ncbi:MULTISPECIES: hypothetical protein [Citrobacter]|uniref:hypothetical protein n=1 Tax=Citrobacter TaxID=544 RepID=UPI00190148A8|nr:MULTISPECIES: hypothetical protein [Citrobacter]MBJ8398322.1 hypothetical protein [Citrobacter youngae]MBJ9600551.1 hypothetical protein [Citrobacter sp. FDAARGOS_156]
MTLDTAFQIALGLAALFGGIFIRRLNQDIHDLEKAVERIRDEYQRREDARTNYIAMMDAMKELRAAIERIDNKLDRKADK